jgi:hypothetical protein
MHGKVKSAYLETTLGHYTTRSLFCFNYTIIKHMSVVRRWRYGHELRALQKAEACTKPRPKCSCNTIYHMQFYPMQFYSYSWSATSYCVLYINVRILIQTYTLHTYIYILIHFISDWTAQIQVIVQPYE